MRKLLIAAITVVTLALAGCGAAYGGSGSSGGSHTTPAPAATTRPGY